MARRDSRNLSVEEWFAEIDQGLDYRRRYGLEDSWNELEALYYNVHPSMASDSANIIAGTGDAFLSELTVPTPYIVVKPTHEGSIDGAPIVESVLNNLLFDLDIPAQVELATLHAYLWGRGILKIGFDSEFGWSPEHDIGGDQISLGMSLTQFDAKGRRIEYARTRPGMPWIRATLPHDIVVPWGVRDIDESPWIFHRIVRHIDDVKADPKYSKTRDLQPVMSMEDYTKSYQSVLKPYRIGWTPRGTSSRKVEFCELWEGHSRRTGRVFTLATGHTKKLRDDNNYLLTEEGYPFVSVGFVPGARNFWTTPDSYYLKFHQAEQTDISIQASKQRRMGTLKFAYDEDAIDNDELEKATSSRVGAGFKVKATGRPLSEVFATLQPGSNLNLYADLAMSQQNARSVVGFSLNRTGEFMKGRKTATETMEVARGGGSRMSRRVNCLRRTYVQTARKLAAVLASLWRAPRMTQVLGAEGSGRWLRFTGQDLRGKFRYGADFTSEAGTSLQARRQEALGLYAGLSQDPFVDQVALRRYLVMSFNDPELAKVFRSDADADLRFRMSQVQGEGGSPAQGRQARPALAMS